MLPWFSSLLLTQLIQTTSSATVTAPLVVTNTVTPWRPQVNMIHIFCGQIIKGKATGFHSHPGGTDPVCAQATDQVKAPSSDKDYSAYNTINIRNGNKWVKKGQRPTSFWPTSLSIPDVVTTIQSLYNSCKPDSSAQSTVCIEEFFLPSASDKFDVEMHMKKGKITSAYPVEIGGCNQIKSPDVKTCMQVPNSFQE